MQKAAPKGTAVYGLGSMQAESAKCHSRNVAEKYGPRPALSIQIRYTSSLQANAWTFDGQLSEVYGLMPRS